MFTRIMTIAAATLLILGLGAVGVVTAVPGASGPVKVPLPAAVSRSVATVQPQQPPAPPQPAVLPLGGHRGAVHAVALDRGGKTLATAGADKTVRLWDLATGRELHNLTQPGEPGSVAFSPDGKKLAALSGGDDGALIVWDADTGKALWRSPPGPKGALASGAVAFSPDGKFVAAQVDNFTKMFDVASGMLTFVLRLPEGKAPAMLAFAPTGTTLAIADGSGAVLLADSPSGRILSKSPGQRPVAALAFLSEAKVAAADGGRALRVLQVDSGKEEAALEGPEAVSALAFTTDGKWAATAGPGGTVVLWDVAAAKQERLFSTPGPVHALALGLGGKLLVTAGADGAMVWDLTRDEKPLPKDFKLRSRPYPRSRRTAFVRHRARPCPSPWPGQSPVLRRRPMSLAPPRTTPGY
jgi:WD40 repeat protein